MTDYETARRTYRACLNLDKREMTLRAFLLTLYLHPARTLSELAEEAGMLETTMIRACNTAARRKLIIPCVNGVAPKSLAARVPMLTISGRKYVQDLIR